ncbi:hypothetical protein QYE76_049719 [Lolium multiflorum]|uniref:Uncharacterized protein n=1 Tax=Lolium multiflorum TaxID=4521 RepID=A0AAD8SPP4_LOLMU|nr:hypothetical protein QYE76_049719 [Lolium multiflorum]
MYPPHDSHESVRYWNAGWFYEKNVSVPEIHDARYFGGGKLSHHTSCPRQCDTAERFDDEEEEEEQAPRKAAPPEASPRQSSRPRAGAGGEASAKKPKTIKPSARLKESGRESEDAYHRALAPHHPRRPNSDYRCHSDHQPRSHHKIYEKVSGCWSSDSSSAKHFPHWSTAPPQRNNLLHRKHSRSNSGASSSLATTSSELENLRSSYQELETKLMEAEQKKEQAEKQPAEKNSELIRKKGEFLLKRNADSETIKRQQKELNGLRKYMETAEHHWDLLAENILEPLGYPERRRNKFPRDDVLSLAGDDCKDLISASRKICHNLSLKKSRTCGLRKLVKKMDILPELVTDLQASSWPEAWLP